MVYVPLPLVKTCTVMVARDSVPVSVGSVRVPEFVIVAITGLVSVLFVSVSVVALPTSVSVATGSVRVPDPATAGAAIVTAPDELPGKIAPVAPSVV